LMLNGIQNWATLKRICIQIWANPILDPA
jgi:hypothetical protein